MTCEQLQKILLDLPADLPIYLTEDGDTFSELNSILRSKVVSYNFTGEYVALSPQKQSGAV